MCPGKSQEDVGLHQGAEDLAYDPKADQLGSNAASALAEPPTFIAAPVIWGSRAWRLSQERGGAPAQAGPAAASLSPSPPPPLPVEYGSGIVPAFDGSGSDCGRAHEIGAGGWGTPPLDESVSLAAWAGRRRRSPELPAPSSSSTPAWGRPALLNALRPAAATGVAARGREGYVGDSHSWSGELDAVLLARGSLVKRSRFSPSPATGLLGVMENAFLGTFSQDFSSFLPVLTERQVRASLVDVMLRGTGGGDAPAWASGGTGDGGAERDDDWDGTGGLRGDFGGGLGGGGFGDSSDGGSRTGGGSGFRGGNGEAAALTLTGGSRTGAGAGSLWAAVALGALMQGAGVDICQRYISLSRDSIRDVDEGETSPELVRVNLLLACIEDFCGNIESFVSYTFKAVKLWEALPEPTRTELDRLFEWFDHIIRFRPERPSDWQLPGESDGPGGSGNAEEIAHGLCRPLAAHLRRRDVHMFVVTLERFFAENTHAMAADPARVDRFAPQLGPVREALVYLKLLFQADADKSGALSQVCVLGWLVVLNVRLGDLADGVMSCREMTVALENVPGTLRFTSWFHRVENVAHILLFLGCEAEYEQLRRLLNSHNTDGRVLPPFALADVGRDCCHHFLCGEVLRMVGALPPTAGRTPAPPCDGGPVAPAAAAASSVAEDVESGPAAAELLVAAHSLVAPPGTGGAAVRAGGAPAAAASASGPAIMTSWMAAFEAETAGPSGSGMEPMGTPLRQQHAGTVPGGDTWTAAMTASTAAAAANAFGSASAGATSVWEEAGNPSMGMPPDFRWSMPPAPVPAVVPLGADGVEGRPGSHFPAVVFADGEPTGASIVEVSPERRCRKASFSSADGRDEPVRIGRDSSGGGEGGGTGGFAVGDGGGSSSFSVGSSSSFGSTFVGSGSGRFAGSHASSFVSGGSAAFAGFTVGGSSLIGGDSVSSSSSSSNVGSGSVGNASGAGVSARSGRVAGRPHVRVSDCLYAMQATQAFYGETPVASPPPPQILAVAPDTKTEAALDSLAVLDDLFLGDQAPFPSGIASLDDEGSLDGSGNGGFGCGGGDGGGGNGGGGDGGGGTRGGGIGGDGRDGGDDNSNSDRRLWGS
ncbi:unnamed protein product [Phaeothamnion confervicola]